jgi:hypothetical protein
LAGEQEAAETAQREFERHAGNGQELPPEPDTGWPAYNLRATARINERT